MAGKSLKLKKPVIRLNDKIKVSKKIILCW